MKKIMIIGSCGAGKSTFAKKLNEVLGIDIIHLDQHYWKPNWTRTDSEEWQKKVERLIKKKQWIMDGNYRSTMDLRLPQADTIIWLDFPRLVCFYRILKRRIRNSRADKLDNCKERVTFELVKWVLWTFPQVNRKDIQERIKTTGNNKNVYVLKSNKEINLFLTKLKTDGQ